MMLSETNIYIILDYYIDDYEIYNINTLTNKIKKTFDDIQYWLEEIKMVSGSIQNILDNLIHSICIKILENSVFNYYTTVVIYRIIERWLAVQYKAFSTKHTELFIPDEEFNVILCLLLLNIQENFLKEIQNYVTKNYPLS